MTTVDRPPTVPAAPRRASSVPRGAVGLAAVIALAALAVLVTGWQGRHEVTVVAPDPVASAAAAVDWSHYRPGFREGLAADSCDRLTAAYTAARIVDGPVDSRPIEAYITALAVAKGCVL